MSKRRLHKVDLSKWEWNSWMDDFKESVEPVFERILGEFIEIFVNNSGDLAAAITDEGIELLSDSVEGEVYAMIKWDNIVIDGLEAITAILEQIKVAQKDLEGIIKEDEETQSTNASN